MGGVMDTTYVALIGDLAGSRALTDRAGAQQRVEAALAAANERWADELAANFVVTLGDEYQGMLKRPDHAFEVIATLEGLLLGFSFSRNSRASAEAQSGSKNVFPLKKNWS